VTLIFNSHAVHFFWSSLRWFYSFIGVQLCLNKRIGLDKESHRPVHIRPYSSQCMSEQMRFMRLKEQPKELRDRIVARHRSGQGYKRISAALKIHKRTMASIILKWKKFGMTRTLPRPSRPAKLNNRWRRALVRGKEEPKDHCGWAPEMQSGDGKKFHKVNYHWSPPPVGALWQSGLLITCPIQSQPWNMVVAALCYGGVFQL